VGLFYIKAEVQNSCYFCTLIFTKAFCYL